MEETNVRLALLFVVLCEALSAQAFADLATTTDGSTLYFTSRLRQKAADQLPDVGKIFRASGSTIDLAAQPMCTVTPALPTRDCALQTPDVSGDGNILAYTFREYDLTGSLNITRGIVARQWFEGPAVDGDRVHISRNGQWAIAYSDIPFSTPQLIDLSTPTATPLRGFTVIGDARQAIADDGTAVVHDGPQNTALWKAGVVTKLTLKHQSGNARIDRSATTIIYEWIDAQYHLNSYDIATGIDRELWAEGMVPPTFVPFAVPSPLHYQPSITDDGRYVLIQAGTRDLWIVATDGSTTRQLTSGAGVTSDVLSGDGIIAYAATSDNRILSVNTITATISEIVSRTAAISPGTTAPIVAPGDFATVGGGGLDNAIVLVNNEPAWVIAAHNGNVAFRIPWDAPIGQTVQISIATDSPFISNLVTAKVQAAVPHPWISQPIHQDFSDYVKPDSPAKPEEVVHLYITGLGITDPLLPLDQPVPEGTLVRAVTPLVCNLDRHGDALPIDAPVLFAGIAPGQTWIYQVDVVIPAGAAGTPNGTLTCGGASFPISVAGQ
jgi:uncharacterized protein (TIGR03437 family)